MEQVSREKFYSIIGPIDAIIKISDYYPYTSTFTKRNGDVIGKVVDEYTNNIEKIYPIISRYFLNKNYI